MCVLGFFFRSYTLTCQWKVMRSNRMKRRYKLKRHVCKPAHELPAAYVDNLEGGGVRVRLTLLRGGE